MKVRVMFNISEYYTIYRPLQSQIKIQFGISDISSFLKAWGYKTKLLVLTRETEKRIIDKNINDFDPRLICFTAVASEYNFIAEISSHIKHKHPPIYLLIGGPHVSLNPERAIKDSFDAVCVGEGEYPTLKLVQQLEKGKQPKKIKNLWIKQGNSIEKNKTASFIQNLDAWPLPDRDMWQECINYPGTGQTIMLVRGCPYHCTYCCNHALRQLASGRYIRSRSPSNIIKELKEIIKKFPKTYRINLEVETVGLSIDYDLELCTKLEEFNKKHKKLTYEVNLRIIPDKDYNKLFKAFRKANIRSISIGLESGSQRVRESILKRFYSNDDIINAIKLAKKYHLQVCVYVMVGIPGETLEDFKDTIECCRVCQPDQIALSIFYPYSGTVLYSYCQKNHTLPHESDAKMERRKAELDLPFFPLKQIQKQYIWFYYNVYKGFKPLHDTLRHVLLLKINSNYISKLWYRRLSSYAFTKKFLSFFKT